MGTIALFGVDPSHARVLAEWLGQEPMAVDQPLTAWLNSQIRPGTASSTWSTRRRVMRAWCRFLTEIGKTWLVEPTQDDVEQYLAWSSAKASPGSARLRLDVLRRFCRWAVANGIMQQDPTEMVNLPATAGTNPAEVFAVDPQSIPAILERVGGDVLTRQRNAALLWCLASSTLESVAWQKACVGDLDLASGTASLCARVQVDGDVPPERRLVVLRAEAGEACRRYLAMRHGPAPDAPLFLAARTGHRLSALSIRCIVRHHLDASGIEETASRQHPRYQRAPRIARSAIPELLARLAPDDVIEARARLLAASVDSAMIAWHELRWGQVYLASKQIRIRYGRGVRHLPLDDELIDSLTVLAQHAAVAPDQVVFRYPDGRPLCRDAWRHWLWSQLEDDGADRPRRSSLPATTSLRRGRLPSGMATLVRLP